MGIFSGNRERFETWDKVMARTKQDWEYFVAVGLTILTLAAAYFLVGAK